jgi:hypothetical protein
MLLSSVLMALIHPFILFANDVCIISIVRGGTYMIVRKAHVDAHARMSVHGAALDISI